MATQASDPKESNSNPPPPPRRKQGRPKGSKDGPRLPDAPKRGRPAVESVERSAKRVDGSSKGNDQRSAPMVDEYGYEELDQSVYNELDLYELEWANGQTTPTVQQTDCVSSSKNKMTREDLQDASEFSQRRPFFSNQTPFSDGEESDKEDDFMEPDECAPKGGLNETEKGKNPAADGRQAWFKQPKRMPYWLYLYFIEKVGPLIFERKGKHLIRPVSFSDRPGAPASLWLHPPTPIMSLSSYTFLPELLYRPRVFLWLPHFFVEILRCPICRCALEKNGACPPRHITDIAEDFWIVTWDYYCRSGCLSHFRGWSPALLESLPPYLRREFPAVLSRKSGLSLSVVSQLRVGNQHKMGPSGVRSLLFEEHTRRFNTLYVQYLEAIYEVVRGRQEKEPHAINP